MQAEIRILIWINRCLRFLQTLDIYTAHCSSASGRSRKPACWRSPPVHHVFLATGATGGVEVEGGGRLNAAENTSFHSAVRRSPNFCRDRAMGGLLTFVLIHHYSAIDASVGSSADVMSTANTYIVYSALIVTAVAAFMTIAGLIFTQHFSMEKERNLSRAYDTLIEELKIENEKAEKIMKEIMKNP